LQTYRILLDLCATLPTLDQELVNFRYGMCAFNLNSIETAYKSLLFSWSIDKENFTLNSTWGKIEYKLAYPHLLKSVKLTTEIKRLFLTFPNAAIKLIRQILYRKVLTLLKLLQK